jgi:hypothetical protein
MRSIKILLESKMHGCPSRGKLTTASTRSMVEIRRWPVSVVYCYESSLQEWVVRSREAVVSVFVANSGSAEEACLRRNHVVARDVLGKCVAESIAVAGAVRRGALVSIRVNGPAGEIRGRFAVLRFPSVHFANAFADFVNGTGRTNDGLHNC